MSERKLARWHEAGLIDAEARDRITAYERDHSRPLALWAVIGIGALAIGLGLISVVAANWEDVPGLVRLAAHFILLAALAGFLWWQGRGWARVRARGLEAALFVFAILGMTFFGHVGQVYQTSAPLWQPLAGWLVLFAPLLLLRGQSWLTAALLFGTLAYTCWDYAVGSFGLSSRQHSASVQVAVVTAMPVLVAPLGAWMRGQSQREAFWKRLEQIALAYAVAGASLALAASTILADGDVVEQMVRAAIAVGAGLLIAVARPSSSGRMSGAVMAGAGIVCVLALGASGSGLFGGLLFMGLWIGIAGAAHRAGWRGVFQLAVGIVAIRLIVLSFELATDLLTSGAGLIASGLLILGIAWMAVRVSRRFAPDQRESE